ncbi:hypothetical protein G7092_09830 [Mucilaginibacter sp. HC2]|uniref:hypothetical protein n=1 Tax=Mucilaginibacter inviolabilis TaxID=2714892 RepID=UPI00140A19A6|nr:hypothetical protein [Mucilaginibacter inviolabilis]NHA04097.1 hypothetical protein [Mucilaginibacter inviolabilis]
MAFYNRQLIMAWYDNAKNNPFKTGDKVYIADYFPLSSSKNDPLLFFRLAKSTSSSDMKIVMASTAVIGDSLIKYKSSYIGTYIKVKYVPGVVHGENVIVPFHSIHLDERVINKLPKGGDILPKVYAYVDSDLYIVLPLVANKERNTY